MEDYDIVPATEADREKIAEFLRQYFYKHEPLNESIGTPLDRPSNSMYSLQFLAEGSSLLAVSRNGRILGVCINGEEKPNPNKETKHQLTNNNESYLKIMNFINKVEDSVDIWKLTGADRAIYIHVVTVDPATRGRGIGRALMESTRDRARSSGYPLIYVLCTSHYTARIARQMDMQNVYSLSYSEYKDEDGNPVFTPPLPHTEITMFVQKLSLETQL